MRIRPGCQRILSVAAGAGLLLAGLAGLASPAGAAAAAGPGVPTPGFDAQLTQVACTPTGQCWAVGYYQRDKASPQYYKSEMYRWTGSQWTQVTVPEPPHQDLLYSVSCPAASYCLAVGSVSDQDVTRPEVLRWTGGNWKPVAVPAGLSDLYSISCVTRTDCEAIGAGGVTRWNGKTWGPVASFSEFDALSSITCASASDCWIDGYYVKPSKLPLYNLVLHGSGSVWTQEKVPQPGAASQLDGIGCASASDCWAVGQDEQGTSDNYDNEALHWNGTAWSLAAIPSPASAPGVSPDDQLFAVTCVTGDDCWTVGTGVGTTEALHWNGTAWSVVSVPAPGGSGFLLGVTCQNRSDCFASGFSHVPPTQNLVLRWNGTTWSST